MTQADTRVSAHDIDYQMDTHTHTTRTYCDKKMCTQISSHIQTHTEIDPCHVFETCGCLTAALQCSVISPAGTEVAI